MLPADPNDEQDVPAATWLVEHGYVELPIGVTDELAMGWAPYDRLIFGIVGIASLAATILLVNRRRPT